MMAWASWKKHTLPLTNHFDAQTHVQTCAQAAALIEVVSKAKEEEEEEECGEAAAAEAAAEASGSDRKPKAVRGPAMPDAAMLAEVCGKFWGID